jgi:hypothetical protein
VKPGVIIMLVESNVARKGRSQASELNNVSHLQNVSFQSVFRNNSSSHLQNVPPEREFRMEISADVR